MSELGTKKIKLGEHPIWENKATLSKTYLFIFFFFLSYINTKTETLQEIFFSWKNSITILKTSILNVFILLRRTMHNSTKSNLYGETIGHYEKRVLQSFKISKYNNTKMHD